MSALTFYELKFFGTFTLCVIQSDKSAEFDFREIALGFPFNRFMKLKFCAIIVYKEIFAIFLFTKLFVSYTTVHDSRCEKNEGSEKFTIID